MSNQKPKVAALFAGAGGLSLGFKMAGFDVVVATDFDKAVEITYSYNNPNTKFIRADIRKLHAEDLLSPAAIKPGEIDLLIGGPPCQGFSLANQLTWCMTSHINILSINIFYSSRWFKISSR